MFLERVARDSCTWTNGKRVIRYVAVDQVETHALVSGFANAVNPILGMTK